MHSLFVTDNHSPQFTAIDAALDTLPPKAKQITIVLDMSPDGLVMTSLLQTRQPSAT